MSRSACAAVLVLLIATVPVEAKDPPLLDDLVRFVCPGFRRVDDHRMIVQGLKPLPRATSARCPALGYHSRAAKSANQIRWVQVDLEEVRALDYVVVVPAIGPSGEDGPGYYFPPRFQVELAERADFSDAGTVAEIDSETVSAHHPVVIRTDGRKARFVRVTATQLAGRDGLYFFALGEMLAISGTQNLAACRPVTASDSIENAPVWGVSCLVDGQAMVGPPLGLSGSPTNGYHSAVSPTAETDKWVQIDLAGHQKLDEVRLVPARPADFADRSGFGFPVRFKVEAASAPDFKSPHVLLDATGSDYPNPGDGLVVIRTYGVEARYIRVTATKLWERTGDYVFALAELQAYANGRNKARGAEVTSLDSIERGLWSRQYLVDGCASKHQLEEWSRWAEHEFHWNEWTKQQHAAEAEWELARKEAYALLVWYAGGGIIFALALLAALAWRSRALRKWQAEKIRARIAHDLHDEVGSNLGSILLLAQSGDGNDLPEIGRIAGQMAGAMRDLVWMMRTDTDTVADLFNKLRETAATSLIGIEYSFDVPTDGATTRISAERKRHYFLAFKEILNNIIRHAKASRVEVRAYWDRGWLILEVKDNGQGFDPTRQCSGTGMRSLQERAATLQGDLEIHSAPGGGAMVRFIASIG
jgi:signal transduction histidine kinase